jgi:tRNA(fMet)-specific endonuclease VapC
MIVADTDVLIDYLGGRGGAAERVAFELEHGNLYTTAVNRFDLESGARSEREGAAVEALLGALRVLPFDASSAFHAAAVRRELEAKGEGIGMANYLIAGTCMAHSGVLLTRNRRHFERIAGLNLSFSTFDD